MYNNMHSLQKRNNVSDIERKLKAMSGGKSTSEAQPCLFGYKQRSFTHTNTKRRQPQKVLDNKKKRAVLYPHPDAEASPINRNLKIVVLHKNQNAAGWQM